LGSLEQAQGVLDDWFVLGQALVIGRTEALKEARTNKPSGRRYNEAIGVWLRETGFMRAGSTVYELLRAGKLKSIRLGRAHRVVVQSIRDLVAKS
jgi:hypothetical protein